VSTEIVLLYHARLWYRKYYSPPIQLLYVLLSDHSCDYWYVQSNQKGSQVTNIVVIDWRRRRKNI